MDGYFISHRLVVSTVRFSATQYNATIKTITLAGLDEEQLWFTSQRWASISREIIPNRFQLIVCIVCIDIAQFTMRQYRNEQAIVLFMVNRCHCIILNKCIAKINAKKSIKRKTQINSECYNTIWSMLFGNGTRLQLSLCASINI